MEGGGLFIHDWSVAVVMGKSIYEPPSSDILLFLMSEGYFHLQIIISFSVPLSWVCFFFLLILQL